MHLPMLKLSYSKFSSNLFEAPLLALQEKPFRRRMCNVRCLIFSSSSFASFYPHLQAGKPPTASNERAGRQGNFKNLEMG